MINTFFSVVCASSCYSPDTDARGGFVYSARERDRIGLDHLRMYLDLQIELQREVQLTPKYVEEKKAIAFRQHRHSYILRLRSDVYIDREND